MLGIIHYDREGAPAFVFDMMEPERPRSMVSCGFLKSEALHPAGSRSERMGSRGSIRAGEATGANVSLAGTTNFLAAYCR
jgi:hypothetical protein